MSGLGPILPPAPEDYFAGCIAGAERAGLRLIGRAAIDSTGHAMRDPVVVHGTSVPTVLFLRHTTLFFSIPGSAFLLQATYNEEQNPDYQAAREGRVVSLQRHPYWKLTLTCGTLPGRWEGSQRWLYVAEKFDETRLYVSEVAHASHPTEGGGRIPMSHRSRSAFDNERDVCDGTYETLLGWWPVTVSAEQFGEAMASMVDALRPHLRAGRLLWGHAPTGYIPLDVFPDCADAFVAQFPPERLLDVMDEIPFGLHCPEAVAELVETANRAYSRG